MRAALVVNPTARRADEAVALVRSACRARGWGEPLVLHTTAESLGGPQAAQAADDGCDHVIAAGGDGTVRAVAQALRGRDVAMGIVPLGTANIMVRNLGVSPRHLSQAVEVATGDTTRVVDLALARLLSPTGEWEPWRPFFVLAGVGADASTVSLVTRELKHHLGWAAYFIAGARTAFRPAMVSHVTLSDGSVRTQRVWTTLVGNAPLVPPGIELFDGASLSDGRLHLLQVCVERPWQWVGIGLSGLVRRRARAARLHHLDVESVRIDVDAPTLVQLDGDVFGPASSVEFRIAPSSVRVAVPAKEM